MYVTILLNSVSSVRLVSNQLMTDRGNYCVKTLGAPSSVANWEPVYSKLDKNTIERHFPQVNWTYSPLLRRTGRA